MANGAELREMLAKTRNQKFRKVSETMIDGWVQSAIASKRRWETDEFKNKFQVEMPIVEAVHNILYEKISPVIEMRILTDKLS